MSALVQLESALACYYDELLAHARRRVHCPSLAADIVQEAGLRLAGGRLPAAVDNPRAYLYRIVNNILIDHQRRDLRNQALTCTLADRLQVRDSEPSAERITSDREQIERLGHIVDELPPRCREVFILRKVHDRDQAEIAARLGISRNMVEKHLRKALLHCVRRLRESDML